MTDTICPDCGLPKSDQEGEFCGAGLRHDFLTGAADECRERTINRLRDELGSAQNNCADYADLVKVLRAKVADLEAETMTPTPWRDTARMTQDARRAQVSSAQRLKHAALCGLSYVVSQGAAPVDHEEDTSRSRRPDDMTDKCGAQYEFEDCGTFRCGLDAGHGGAHGTEFDVRVTHETRLLARIADLECQLALANQEIGRLTGMLDGQTFVLSQNRCVDCRFWNRNGASVIAPGDEFAECDTDTRAHTPRDGNRKRCLRIQHFDAYDKTGADQAVLTDGSGYAAALWTAPEFGCSWFERAQTEAGEPK